MASKTKIPAKKSSTKGKQRPRIKVKTKIPVQIPPIEEEELPEDQLSEEELQLRLEEKKRTVWENNNEVISTAFLQAVAKNKRYPTYAQLAKTTGFNERTIRRHFEQSNILGDQTQKLYALRDKSLITIGIKAMKGESVHWSRLFHEIIDGNIGGKRLTVSTKKETIPPTSSSAGKIEEEVTLQLG